MAAYRTTALDFQSAGLPQANLSLSLSVRVCVCMLVCDTRAHTQLSFQV